jgi:hypothetical protein
VEQRTDNGSSCKTFSSETLQPEVVSSLDGWQYSSSISGEVGIQIHSVQEARNDMGSTDDLLQAGGPVEERSRGYAINAVHSAESNRASEGNSVESAGKSVVLVQPFVTRFRAF